MQAFIEDISGWIQYACAANNVLSLAHQIKYSFNPRLTNALGQALCGEKSIKFSAPLWQRASLQDRRQVTIHEACHIIAHELYGGHIKAHGNEWKHCMVNAGVPPDARHHVNRDGLKRKYVKYEIECDCSKVWIGHNTAAQIRKSIHFCSRCKSEIVLTGKEFRQ